MLFQILTILHLTVLLPPMGLFHKPVNTKLRKPIVSYVLEKKQKDVKNCTTSVWNMSMSLKTK